MAAELSTCIGWPDGLLRRKRPKWSIAAARQFTRVPDDPFLRFQWCEDGDTGMRGLVAPGTQRIGAG
jgi:hypothetical protein